MFPLSPREMRISSSRYVVSSTPRADDGAGNLSQPMPKRRKTTSTVRKSSRGSSFARTEFLSRPMRTHSSFLARSVRALMCCRMRGRGLNGQNRLVPRIASDVVYIKRQRPDNRGDSSGFGVGFNASNASTCERTVARRSVARPWSASRASCSRRPRGPDGSRRPPRTTPQPSASRCGRKRASSASTSHSSSSSAGSRTAREASRRDSTARRGVAARGTLLRNACAAAARYITAQQRDLLHVAICSSLVFGSCARCSLCWPLDDSQRSCVVADCSGAAAGT
mmetsp:Transcript_8799/g.27471  ORF Transcript_8799/g.27471 Transcript_8799/m.27471 type:complete len:281 (+) Transcript_8799:74-916(+)